MAKRKMSKGLKSGGAKDGARPNRGRASALLPQNKMQSGRKKRIAKMEKADVAV